ncbi:hypothetical protein, partial [Pseudoxanthomonas sp. KAs_5_3]|uniref:hypothetical protein n=1 Tax=Pseudoxanthomonas sp. KAs_5_3 TaxID=2067658 RepID=UPI000D4EDDDB
FSLETQAYLMHCIAAVFPGDAMKLSNAQSEALTTVLTDTYCDALGTSARMPSADVLRRLPPRRSSTSSASASPRRSA